MLSRNDVKEEPIFLPALAVLWRRYRSTARVAASAEVDHV
jgi:hypothetical protein